MAEKIAGVTDEAVQDATGRGWNDWFGVLDEQDGETIDHTERVAILADAGVESGWWQQKLAVGYEQERGLREIGETADAGYEIGVQRTVASPRQAVWEAMTGTTGLDVWLGDVGALAIESGETYETAGGTTGEIRTVADGERIRLTFQPANRDSPTTLQLTLSPARSDERKTVIRIHHEKLADADEREAMRAHWTDVLDELEETVLENIGSPG